MKKYIKPAIKAFNLDIESAILDASLGIDGEYSGPAGIRRRTFLEEDEFENDID